MLERDFQDAVIDLAHLGGYKVAHFRPLMDGKGRWKTPVQADGAGFPDLILVKGDRIIAAELKVGKNKTTPAQKEWLCRLSRAGVETYVWHPNDVTNIMGTLSKAWSQNVELGEA